MRSVASQASWNSELTVRAESWLLSSQKVDVGVALPGPRLQGLQSELELRDRLPDRSDRLFEAVIMTFIPRIAKLTHYMKKVGGGRRRRTIGCYNAQMALFGRSGDGGGPVDVHSPRRQSGGQRVRSQSAEVQNRRTGDANRGSLAQQFGRQRAPITALPEQAAAAVKRVRIAVRKASGAFAPGELNSCPNRLRG